MSTAVPEPTVPTRGGIRAEPLPPPAGLVESETSHTPNPDQAEILGDCDRRKRQTRLYKSVTKAAELAQMGTPRGSRSRGIMVTLTYRPEVYWNPGHISEYLTNVRNWADRRGVHIRYVWVAELQRNGRVHYHVLFWVPARLSLPKPDKQGWWKHGMSRIEVARRAVAYLAKYASKGTYGEFGFPKGCRQSGFGGLDLAQRQIRSWWVLPRYQRERCMPEDRVRRAPGGGWVSLDTGEWWPAWKSKMWEWTLTGSTASVPCAAGVADRHSSNSLILAPT